MAILPGLLTALAGLHLLLIQRQGMSVPLGVERTLKPGESLPRMRFVPNYLLRDMVGWYLALAVLAALAAFFPGSSARRPIRLRRFPLASARNGISSQRFRP